MATPADIFVKALQHSRELGKSAMGADSHRRAPLRQKPNAKNACRDLRGRGRQSGDVLQLGFSAVKEAGLVEKTEIDKIRKADIADIGKPFAC